MGNEKSVIDVGRGKLIINPIPENASKNSGQLNLITRRIREDKGKINEEKIRQQMGEVEPLLDYGIDPRGKYHLDTTKIAFHKNRVEALERGEKIAPITVDMALTQKCNASCVYCYAGLQYNDESPTTWQQLEYLIDDFATIGHKPGEHVKAVSIVSDGESTLNPFFNDFILYGKRKGIDMAVGTNGLKLDHARLNEILPALTYLRFNISAVGKEAYKRVMGADMYDRFIENVKECVRIKKAGGLEVTLGLQMVLLPEYADQVIPLALLGRELGVDYTVIKHCSDDEKGSLGVDYSWYHSPIANDLLHVAEALSTPEHSVQAKWSKMKTGRDRKYNRCHGTPLMLQISGTGIVAPCGSFFGKGYEEFHIGNFANGERRFRDIWASDRYWQVIGRLKSPGFNPQYMCETLCLQDKVNEKLFDYFDNGIELPDVTGRPIPPHINFI